MSWTKQELIEEAFSEIGKASYVYDLTPDIMSNALRRLDSMMATWDVEGIKLGYPLSSSPGDSNLSDVSNIPLSANEAVYFTLALRIAPLIGKVAQRETKTAARKAKNNLVSASIQLLQQQFPSTMPFGAGNKRRIRDLNNFHSTPDTSPILYGDDGQLIFVE